ncbi:MAG: glycosyltransferase family 4 protein [Coleofasciculaceae cyanobacterium]
MAINLAEAFREQGHDVTLWSPHPLPPQTKWWQSIQQMRSKLNTFIETQQPFDVIDIPGGAGLITRKVSQLNSVIVARSVQPPILYILRSLSDCRGISPKETIRNLIKYLYSIFLIFLVLQDWKRAKYILCLGSLEMQWTRKWFPWWKKKLAYYINALSKADQEALSEIRLYRRKPDGEGIRFLWIGRWNAQKGTNELLDFIVKRTALDSRDTFTIAGCGSEAEKDCPLKLLESGKIRFLPSFERSQLGSLLASHDVGLFTSKVEGWGLVLNEMLESGMTVFANSVGGVPDLKPYFKEILTSFPPSSELTARDLVVKNIQEDYYQKFNWKAIASYYLNLLSLENHQK